MTERGVIMKLSQETLNNISRTLMNTIGMDYEEFEKLGIEEQQKLINQYQKNNQKKTIELDIAKQKYLTKMIYL